MVDLLRKKVSIKDPYFLQFFYPHFTITNNLDSTDIDYTQGIIYTGVVSESVVKKVEYLTGGKYILVSDLCDIKLETSTDFIKVFFPALESKVEKYTNYDLVDLLPILKVYYILQKRVPVLKEDELSVYSLFEVTIHPSRVDEIYFGLLSSVDIQVLISSFLSFLIKVNEEDYNTQSVGYKKLINNAHIRHGKKIPGAIRQYMESSQIPEIAFWNLLHTLVD